ncbi:SEC-C domain-containing protein [Pseudoalteromonas sp. SR43-2]|uniref:SEC-C domain-containing protein n=1 Tax=Pseudoalteromonas sp. SR43-2 TaxID=2760944 RepID=UPI0015F7D435|nr:SEC-C domain-containing protein [Pseudoalteromonas sp. SR43-2]MBB1376900.1 SEC-C domain-containing protein [Pseudoalteromonas sp. SR43-2]
MSIKDIRNEAEIFTDLSELSASPGFVHAIAYLCFRDNTFSYNLDKGVESEDVLQQFSMERLVRTEISALIGLAFKHGIDFKIPEQQELQYYANKAEQLLHEYHIAMMPSPENFFKDGQVQLKIMGEMISSGEMLREAIFYGGESAFQFQYRDLCLKKYKKDSDFFLIHKGYTLQQAYDVIYCLEGLQNKHLNCNMKEMITKDPSDWTFLPAFTFTYEEVVKACRHDLSIVKNILDSFTASGLNETYASIDSFNTTNAYPIIKINEEEFLLLQYYSLVEAFYETPFFWFLENSNYKSTALKNRGDFTEEFAYERLIRVFGKGNVHKNINIYGADGNIAGEVDVLVTYADRAIVLQAKSKKLTLQARQGNKSNLESDFEKAVQAAYGQAYSCAEFMLEPDKYTFKHEDGTQLKRIVKYKEIYIICLVSDHYPALFTQSKQFLKTQESESIVSPYVMDVFFLDTLTEMLDRPFHFLSYINRRATYDKQVHASFELTVLSYHLRKNLWIEDDLSYMYLGDDICADLDLAMMVRRRGIPGNDTPVGILTEYEGTPIDRLIKQIEQEENANIIDFAFLLLSLSGDVIRDINKAIDRITELSCRDGKTHDLTMFFDKSDCGFTIHTNGYPKEVALNSLSDHCEKRKYTTKASKWHGICIQPNDGSFRFGVTLDFEWQYSAKMGEIVRHLPKPQKSIDFNAKNKRRNNIGRNELCPCNSGKKYKKCCL